MTVAGHGDGATVTVTVDPAWLTAPARVWPVQVDPSVALTADTFTQVESGAYASTNVVNPASACTGRNGSPGNELFHALVRFPDVGTVIPRDSVITRAQVSLNPISGRDTAGALRAYPVTRSWDPGSVTWNSSGSGTPWTTPGGDSDPRSGISIRDNGHVLFGAQRAVQGWLDGSTTQQGFLIRPPVEGGTGLTCFATGAGSSSLYVDYVPRGGLGGGAQFFDRRLDDRLGVHVNLASGNLVVDGHDLAGSSPGVPMTLTRTYNSLQADLHQSAGAGWSANLTDAGAAVPTLPPSPTLVGEAGAFWPGDGSRQVFPVDPDTSPATGNAVVTPATGTRGAQLTATGAPGSQTVTWRDGPSQATVTQTDRGYGTDTVVVRDRDGNAMTTRYDNGDTGAPVDITDTAGRTYGYQLQRSTTGLPTGAAITRPQPGGAGTEQVRWAWAAGTDQLASSVDTAGQTTSYAYDSSRRLSAVTTPAGRTTLITYDSRNRVISLVAVRAPAGCDPATPSSPGCAGPTTTFAYTDPTVTGGPGLTDTPPAQAPNGTTGTTRVRDADSTGPADTTHTTTYTWTSRDLITSAVDANGTTRSRSYGPDDNLLTATAVAGTGTPTTTSYGPGPYYNPAGSTAPTGAHGRADYGVPTNTTGAAWLPSASVDPQGNSTAYAYDTTLGHVTGVTHRATDGTTTGADSAAYQGSGASCAARPGSVCSTTTQRDTGHTATTTYGYDCAAPCGVGQGNLVTVTPPAPLPPTTYRYDSLARLTSSTDGKGSRTDVGYDSDDRVLTQTTYPVGSSTAARTVTVGYDSDGNPTSRSDTTTGTTTYTYDPLGRLSAKTAPGASGFGCTDPQGPSSGDYTGSYTGYQYRYDAAGNLRSTCDGGGTQLFDYDRANHVVGASDPSSPCANSSGTLTYSLTGALPASGGSCTLFGYDPTGARTTTRYPSGVTQSTRYDASRRADRVCSTRGATPGDPTPANRPAAVDCDATTLGRLTYDAYSYRKPTGAFPTSGLSRSGQDDSPDGELTQNRRTMDGAPLASLDYRYDGANQLTGSDGYTSSVLGTTTPPTGIGAQPTASHYWPLDETTGSTFRDATTTGGATGTYTYGSTHGDGLDPVSWTPGCCGHGDGAGHAA